MIQRIFIIIICTLLSTNIFSQKIKKDKSPKKAALYSAILPGTGQIYTQKYWKTPLIYIGIITSVYFIEENNKQYNNYKEAALLSYETGENQLGHTYSELKTLKDHYRRNKDVSYFSLAAIYLLNIVDASVNAHLYNFDVSEDISININPNLSLYNSGVTLSLNF